MRNLAVTLIQCELAWEQPPDNRCQIGAMIDALDARTDLFSLGVVLYQMVRKRLPKISLGTVYRNLEIMSECGIIQKLDIGGTQKRFDATAHVHYHVRCNQCGRVDDLDLPPDFNMEKAAGKLTSFKILRHRLEFTGICPQCQP